MTALTSSSISDATFKKLYRQLNREQRRAVDAIEGVVMVVAGPGTGKTQVVAMRIANILRQTQLRPENILCLTFTESGVTAMRKRLLSIVGPTAYYVRIRTFHSFCNDVIQENPEKFSFAKELEVLGDIERVELFREIVDALPGTSPLKPYGNPYLYVPELIHSIGRLKQEHMEVTGYRRIVTQLTKFEVHARAAVRQLSKVPRVSENSHFHQKIMRLHAAFPQLQAHVAYIDTLYKEYRARRTSLTHTRARNQTDRLFANEARRWHSLMRHRLPKQRAVTTVYQRYQALLRERGRYDYEDMLLFVVERLKNDEEFLAHYQEQFQYILVDEYQDTNGAQNEAVALLGAFHNNPNIFVVGDDKQSVFRFQGASLENMLYLYERYREVMQTIVLRKNYRSPQLLLDAAGAVIAHNKETIDRYIPATAQRLVATRTFAHAVTVREFDRPEAEEEYLVNAITRLLGRGVATHDIVIVARRNAEVADIAEHLRSRNIPVQAVQEATLLDTVLVRQLFTLLRYLVLPDQAATLFTILNFDFLKLPALDVVKLQRYSVREQIDLFAALSSQAHLARAEVGEMDTLQRMSQRLAGWQAAAANETAPVFLARLLQEAGVVAYMERTSFPGETLSRVRALFKEAELLHRRQRHISVAEFLHHLQLLEEHHLVLPQDSPTLRSAVSVMTAHKAKGLEFSYVFIARAVDKNWGNLRGRALLPLPAGILKFDPIWEQTHNEDERRLFYVAMTRAKRELNITYATHSASGREQVPSIFLAELPSHQISRRAAPKGASLRTLPFLTRRAQKKGDRMLREYLHGMLDGYVLSVTHLNDYLECPRRFYFRHLLRVPSVPSKQLAFGTAVHGALYDFYSRLTPRRMPSKALLLKSFKKRLQREILSEVEEKDTLERGMALLSAYYEHYRAEPYRRAFHEYSFGAAGVRVDGIPLTGRIDKIEIIDPAGAQINAVDYKTSNPDRKRAELKPGGAYHRQLVFYKLLIDHAPHFPYTMRSGEIDFLQPSAARGQYVKKKITVMPEDTQKLRATVKKVWGEIQALAFLDPVAAGACGECEFCQLSE